MFSLYGLWWSLENKIHAKNRDNCVLFSISFLFLCISGWKLAQWTWGSLPPSTAGMMNSLQSVAWSWSWFFMCMRMYEAKHAWEFQKRERHSISTTRKHSLAFFLRNGFRSISWLMDIDECFGCVGIQAPLMPKGRTSEINFPEGILKPALLLQIWSPKPLKNLSVKSVWKNNSRHDWKSLGYSSLLKSNEYKVHAPNTYRRLWDTNAVLPLNMFLFTQSSQI